MIFASRLVTTKTNQGCPSQTQDQLSPWQKRWNWRLSFLDDLFQGRPIFSAVMEKNTHSKLSFCTWFSCGPYILSLLVHCKLDSVLAWKIPHVYSSTLSESNLLVFIYSIFAPSQPWLAIPYQSLGNFVLFQSCEMQQAFQPFYHF